LPRKREKRERSTCGEVHYILNIPETRNRKDRDMCECRVFLDIFEVERERGEIFQCPICGFGRFGGRERGHIASPHINFGRSRGKKQRTHEGFAMVV